MLEKDMWAKVRKNIGTRWRAHRIENRLDEGTPDVFFSIQAPGIATRIASMIELKSQEPRKNSTVKIPHYTQEQRDFVKLHHTFLLLYCNGHYLLFGPTTAHLVGLGQSFEAHQAVALYASDCPDWDEFISILTRQILIDRTPT